MYDQQYVIPGIIILLLLLFSPLIYDASVGAQVKEPELAKAKATNCVEDTEWMLANHMELLKHWRTLRVREGQTTYKTKYGTFNLSMEETCFKCHTSSEEFCDKCHHYAGVDPYCWQCHNTPKIVEEIKQR